MQAVIVKLFLLFFVAKVKCHSDLMCYVCDDCPKVTKETPLLPCNANSFNENPTTMMTMMTTMKTTKSMSMSSTTTMPTTTKMPPSNETISLGVKNSTKTTILTTATPMITERILSTQEFSNDTTTESIPQPPTVGPLSSTTTVPTPPTEGTLIPSSNESLIEDKPVNKSYMSSSTFRGQRQLRHIVEDPVTYHCFTIEKKYAGKNRIQRGCSFVHTNEAVCTQLKVANNYTVNKCVPCSKNQCNGSSTIKISIVTFAVAAVLALIKH